MAKGAPIGLGKPLWFNPAVWEPAGPKQYDDPHEEDRNYGTALPFLKEIRSKFSEETAPGVDRMSGPHQRRDLKERYGDRYYEAPLGARPKVTEPFFRVIHDATAPGLNQQIALPGRVRRPTIEDLRTVVRRRLGRYGILILDTKDAHRTISVAEEDWGAHGL